MCVARGARRTAGPPPRGPSPCRLAGPSVGEARSLPRVATRDQNAGLGINMLVGVGLAATLLLLPTRQPRSAVSRSAGPQVEAVDWSARIFRVENFLRCALASP